MSRLFALVALLTISSLANAFHISDLRNYTGLNFGIAYGNGKHGYDVFQRYSVVIGYRYDESSILEFEVGRFTCVLPYLRCPLENIYTYPMINYSFYPDPYLDPWALYISAGLGGHIPVEKSPYGHIPIEESVAKENYHIIGNILRHIRYKVKVGIDSKFSLLGYKFDLLSQVISTSSIMVDGTLFGITRLNAPTITVEIGMRYNF